MIRDLFEKLQNEFPTHDVKEVFPFANNPLADYIRQEIPKIFSQEFSTFKSIKWDASAGKGQWADAPWIAAFNPAITHTAQDGYYPVLLFSSSLDTIYLSLNQGMTKLRKEFKRDKDAVKKLEHNAEILRIRLGSSYKDLGFSDEPIDLQPRHNSDRLYFYQPGHAFGKAYKKDRLPPNDVLKNDISNMLRLYAISFSKGGTSELDYDENPNHENGHDGDNGKGNDEIRLEEKLRYKQHRSIERNKELGKQAKKIHGYICQVCGFDFEERYGELGKEFIEAHHKTPLHTLPIDQFVSLSPRDDFAVLCSNCHSMIHRKNAPADFDEFVRIYS